jgi:hypothetical protein
MSPKAPETRSRKSTPASSAAVAAAGTGMSTGILVRSDMIVKFLDTTAPKTAEIRTKPCHIFSVGDTLYLLECGLKYKGPGGRACFRVMASAKWAGSEPVERSALPGRLAEHRVTDPELESVYPVSGSHTKFFLWHMTDITLISTKEIFYIESCQKDRVLGDNLVCAHPAPPKFIMLPMHTSCKDMRAHTAACGEFACMSQRVLMCA